MPNNVFNKSKKYRLFLIFIIFVLTSFFSAIISGFFMAIGGNVGVINFEVAFDPVVTIAYLFVYHFLLHFYQLSNRQNYFYFILAITLSFTTEFIQGSILMIVLPLVLKRFRLI